MRFMVAINAGPALGIRDQQGNIRYDPLLKALQSWGSKLSAPGQKEGEWDYSLFTNQGALANTVSDPTEWLKAVNAYQPEMRSVQPSQESLSRALSLAALPTPRFGMERAILYITPLPEEKDLASLTDLGNQARQSDTHIFIWMVASPQSFTSPAAIALNKLAVQSGGEFFEFSGTESLPDIQTYLEPLRYLYALKYTSAITTPGSHSLLVKVKRDDLEINSPLHLFTITNVQPPNPIFISPPPQITRSSPADSSTPLEDLAPREQTLEIMVEFPDGHPRPLKYARLYVDDQLMDENTTAPFERFTWDLSHYTAAGRHMLRVDVMDSLGLTRSSSETAIMINITLIQRKPLEALVRSNILPSAAAIALAGGALALVLFLGWRRRTQAAAPGSSPARRGNDPLTQPIPAAKSRFRFAGKPAPDGRTGKRTGGRTAPAAWAERLAWPQPAQSAQSSLAQLLRLDENLAPLPGSPISINTREMTIGADPIQSSCVIEAPSVAGLHARLKQIEDGCFILMDEGSIAGTWVNFAPISGEGVHLVHGDLVHIGKVSFRFELGQPLHIRTPQVRPYKENP
jgi:hypothetical protein